MVVQTQMSSTLNPNAPLFFPAAFVETEDFSPEWFQLVENCPAFRDYWLAERYAAIDDPEAVDEDFLDIHAQMEKYFELDDAEELECFKLSNGLSRDIEKDLVSAFTGLEVNRMKLSNTWREPFKHHDKTANKPLKSPRKGSMHRIQQPRP